MDSSPTRERRKGPYCGMSKRFTLAILISTGLLITSGLRCNLGVAIVKMVDNSTGIAEFDWDMEAIRIIDLSFFFGYLVTQAPGGILAGKYKATMVFGLGILLTSLIHLLIPLAAKVGHIYLSGLRSLQGLAEGVTLPAFYGIWRWWAPPLERTTLATLGLFGAYTGMVIGMPVSGYLVESFGWETPFHAYGIFGCLWAMIWFWKAFETPRSHPNISQEELNLIEKSIGPVSQQKVTLTSTPWRAIFSSMPVWAVIVATCCSSWTYYFLIIVQPLYFREVFNFNVAQGGVLALLPHLMLSMLLPLGGALADRLRRKGHLGTKNTRKLFTVGGFAAQATCFLVLIFAQEAALISIAALVLAAGFFGLAISGYHVNCLDIAPRYASIIMGITNSAGILTSLICSVVVDSLTITKTMSDWEKLFLIAAGVDFCGLIFYGTFASGEVQSWAEPHRQKKGQEDETMDLSP